MPPLTRWFIKTALVYFVLGLAAGLLLAAQKLWPGWLPSAGFFPVYLHLLVTGWLTMFIIGVVLWMFPKYSREQPRGSEPLAWACYLLLNLGLLLRIISEPAAGLAGASASIWGILLAAAAVLQWLGGMAFIFNTWARVKEK